MSAVPRSLEQMRQQSDKNQSVDCTVRICLESGQVDGPTHLLWAGGTDDFITHVRSHYGRLSVLTPFPFGGGLAIGSFAETIN